MTGESDKNSKKDTGKAKPPEVETPDDADAAPPAAGAAESAEDADAAPTTAGAAQNAEDAAPEAEAAQQTDAEPPEEQVPTPEAPPPLRRPGGFKRPWPSRKPLENEAIAQFYATLDATFRSVKGTEPSDTVTKVQELLDADDAARSWRSAYQAEQLIVDLMSGEKLRTELLRRVVEAKRINLPGVEFYEARVSTDRLDEPAAASGDKEAGCRALLARLTNDLQWFYMGRYLKRKHTAIAVQKVSSVFFICFVIFSFILVMLSNAPPCPSTGTEASATDIKGKYAHCTGLTETPSAPPSGEPAINQGDTDAE